jgi:glycosyl hydrolase family 26
MVSGSRRALSRWLGVSGLLLASLAAPEGLAPARAARGGNPVPPPKEGSWFGAYVQSKGNAEEVKADILEREKALGRPFDLDHFYNHWNSDFPNWREVWDHASGRIPFISWAKTSTTSVNSGKYDRQIAERAAGLKALGGPVLLEWFWEMDGARNRHIAKSPASFIAAWRRIHGIFRKEKADNVAFVWCPNAWGFVAGEAAKWYPGDGYVDWICANGYNWAPGRRGDDWRSFEDIFQPFYDWASAKDKPLLIGEFGVQERRSGEKAQWMKDARNTLKDRFPDIKALAYFDSDSKHDWRVITSRSAFDAYRAWARDDHFDPPGLPIKLKPGG